MPEDPRSRGVELRSGDVVGIVNDARAAQQAQSRLASESLPDDEIQVLSGETGAALLETPNRRGLARFLPFSGRSWRETGAEWAEHARGGKYIVHVRETASREPDEALRVLRDLNAIRIYRVGIFGPSLAA